MVVLALVLVGMANAADSDLVAHWKFDDDSGTTAIDSSGNGNDGTFMGDPQWASGKLGGALDFDGARCHAVDGDAAGTQFDGGDLSEVFDSALRGGVVDEVGEWAFVGTRSDVDDATPCFLHDARGLLSAVLFSGICISPPVQVAK